MAELFTLAEAGALLPDVQERVAGLIEVRAELADLRTVSPADAPAGAVAERKALEARLHEGVEWFPRQGLQLKGVAPFLVDFPALADGSTVLLCWLEGEPALAWYHRPEVGFMGRRPIADLDRV